MSISEFIDLTYLGLYGFIVLTFVLIVAYILHTSGKAEVGRE